MTQFGLFPAVTGPEIKTHNLYFILPFLSCAVGCPKKLFRNLHRSAGFPPRLNGFESSKVVMKGSWARTFCRQMRRCTQRLA